MHEDEATMPTGQELVAELLDTYPKDLGIADRDALAACIGACVACAQACTACADACLGEDDVAGLTLCVRTCLDGADVCLSTGRVLSRRTGYDATVAHTVLETCAVVCRASGDECHRHAPHHAHCRVCEGVCRRCESACRDLMVSLG